jgi:hypothetical protein
MAQTLQNHLSVASNSSANKIVFPLIASNEPLPLHQNDVTPANPPEICAHIGQLYGISDWAIRMIGVTWGDWVKHGCVQRKIRKYATHRTARHVPATPCHWARKFIETKEQLEWGGQVLPNKNACCEKAFF